MDFAYDIDDDVTLVQGYNESQDQVFWNDKMDEYIGKRGVIIERFHHIITDRPVYGVEFDNGGYWTAEEYWLNPFHSIKDVASDDAKAIDSFMEEW